MQKISSTALAFLLAVTSIAAVQHEPVEATETVKITDEKFRIFFGDSSGKFAGVAHLTVSGELVLTGKEATLRLEGQAPCLPPMLRASHRLPQTVDVRVHAVAKLAALSPPMNDRGRVLDLDGTLSFDQAAAPVTFRVLFVLPPKVDPSGPVWQPVSVRTFSMVPATSIPSCILDSPAHGLAKLGFWWTRPSYGTRPITP